MMFRFTIRDLLWLMVVVGLATGWWIDRAAERRRFEEFRDTTMNKALEKIDDHYAKEFKAEVEKLRQENAATAANQ